MLSSDIETKKGGNSTLQARRIIIAPHESKTAVSEVSVNL